MQLRIQLVGSMGTESAEFSANEYGHAHAINEAIAYLTGLQEKAINFDHDVRDSNESGPKLGWQKGQAITRPEGTLKKMRKG
jgi:isocitrate lyase